MRVSGRYVPVSEAASRARGDELVAWLRDWAERRLDSRLADERRGFPPHVVLDLGNRGIFGVQVEEKYGGLALRTREVGRVLEQAAAIDLAFGTWILVCLFPGIRPLAAFASPVRKDELLPELARGRMLAGYAQTEPGAGTNFPAMAATAQAQSAASWRLSGDKVWIGNASWAGVLTAMAHDVDARGRRGGLTAFAVRTDRPGVVLGAELLSMGMRGVIQSEVGFRDVHLDIDDVVGEPKRGLEVGVDSMSWTRFSIAATCVGAMKQCAKLMLRFGARRHIATGRLVDHPVIRSYLAETTARISAAESLLDRVVDDVDSGRGATAELFAAAKLVGSEFLWQSADQLVQVLGSRGYDEANGVPQLLRDARVTRIFEGASEALVAFVGAQALSPRSELDAMLRDELTAGDVAERLAECVGRMRAAVGDMPRARQCALAGQAAVWGLVSACLATPGGREPRAQREGTLAWARARFDAACQRAAAADEGRPDFDLPLLEETIEGYLRDIGDVEQAAPGERIGLDPLLRRTP